LSNGKHLEPAHHARSAVGFLPGDSEQNDRGEMTGTITVSRRPSVIAAAAQPGRPGASTTLLALQGAS
jgi:hypothetical protein